MAYPFMSWITATGNTQGYGIPPRNRMKEEIRQRSLRRTKNHVASLLGIKCFPPDVPLGIG
jgi:hypothetical protein